MSKVWLITGSGSGLGRSIAKAALELGDRVVATARNTIPLADLQYGIQLNDLAFNQSLRPYPQYQGFNLYGQYPVGRYQRDAGYVRLEKRSSSGLSVNANFEFNRI